MEPTTEAVRLHCAWGEFKTGLEEACTGPRTSLQKVGSWAGRTKKQFGIWLVPAVCAVCLRLGSAHSRRCKSTSGMAEMVRTCVDGPHLSALVLVVSLPRWNERWSISPLRGGLALLWGATWSGHSDPVRRIIHLQGRLALRGFSCVVGLPCVACDECMPACLFWILQSEGSGL